MHKLVILFLLFTFPLNAQVNLKDSLAKKQVYYWFSISIGKIYDKETEMNKIVVKDVGYDIKSGFFEDFAEDHDAALKSGRITLGPYAESYHVQNAQTIYRNAGKETYNTLKKKYSDEEQFAYSFFYVNPILSDTLSQIGFERIPSRVTIGNQGDFISMLNEGLNFEKLAIGPFYDYESSEKAKFVFRKNGETGNHQPIDSIKARNLRIMAKKWRTLKFDITKKSEDPETHAYIYRFSTNFPKKYFATDAYQVIKITASYSDSFETSTACFTLQGDEVIDNNFIIASTSNTIYINMLQFDNHSPSKLNGFFFESFVYNDYELIEMEPFFVKLK